jgi:L-rhamnose mutarotase
LSAQNGTEPLIAACGDGDMQRFGMMIRLKPGSEVSYRQYHAAVWPEVLQKIRECNIENYSIFFKDNILYSYFEYRGSDVESDFKKMAADPKTQEWWSIMEPMQEPLPTRKKGEWWATMEEVFHLD